MAITGGREGVVAAHTLNVIESLEKELTKRKLSICHNKNPIILYSFCAGVTAYVHSGLIGDGRSNSFAITGKVFSSSGYGVPNSTATNYDLERQFESDVYSQDAVKEAFSIFGIVYKGTIDSDLIDALAYFYAQGVLTGNTNMRNAALGAFANIIDPSARTWDGSKVNLGR